jgi:hypothetical protein
LDPTVVQPLVESLIDEIQGSSDPNNPVPSVAQTMTQGFIDLYDRVISALQASLPGSQAEINQLQQKIQTLNQFLQTL